MHRTGPTTAASPTAPSLVTESKLSSECQNTYPSTEKVVALGGCPHLRPALVVKLERDSEPLRFLGGEDPSGCLPALGLQPPGHLVERQRQLARLRGRRRPGHPLPGPGAVEAAGERGHRLERLGDPSQQQH